MGRPCGDLLASSKDMAQWLMLFARRREPRRVSEDRAERAHQIIDGATLTEMLQPVVMLRDGSSAVGTPFEFKYSNGLWLKSKQGGDPGYRSSITLSEDLELGIFFSALTDPVPEDSVWTIPAADILTKALREILWSHQPRIPIAQPERLVGEYYGNWSVYQVDASTLQARLGAHASPLNLTAFTPLPDTGHGNGTTVVLRAHPTGSAAQAGCRWLDDGSDQELMYFEMDDKSPRSVSVEFKGSRWFRHR